MDVLIGFLMVIGLFLIGLFGGLYFHSRLYGNWKQNFSLQNIIKNIGELLKFLLIGVVVIGVFHYIKSIFTKD